MNRIADHVPACTAPTDALLSDAVHRLIDAHGVDVVRWRRSGSQLVYAPGSRRVHVPRLRLVGDAVTTAIAVHWVCGPHVRRPLWERGLRTLDLLIAWATTEAPAHEDTVRAVARLEADAELGRAVRLHVGDRRLETVAGPWLDDELRAWRTSTSTWHGRAVHRGPHPRFGSSPLPLQLTAAQRATRSRHFRASGPATVATGAPGADALRRRLREVG